MSAWKGWLSREDGQDLVEYAYMLGLVALCAAATIITLGGSLNSSIRS